MKVLHSFTELTTARNQFKGRLGLVPTMGALHDGHLSLIHKLRPQVDVVMVTIFVNPTQFGPNEDFSRYPRQEQTDLAKLEQLVDFAYLPQVSDIYPTGDTTIIKAGKSAKGLDGEFRPGHFDGVATVVSILLKQTRPDIAIFGEKDYQQLQVINEMTTALTLPVKIISGETLREPDGLAMSSRNAYLTQEERAIAPKLHEIMQKAALTKNLPAAISALEELGFNVQYLEPRWNRLLAAAYLGKTRLIDNILLED